MRGRIAVAMVGSLWAVAGASADVLVMRDGSRIETKGEWQVRSGSVVFTMPNGTLGSLRARDVDLDASAAATAAQKAPPPPVVEPAAPREAVLTLTDDDVSKAPMAVSEPAPEDDQSEAADGAAQRPAAVASTTVTVTSWEESYDVEVGGIRVSGMLRNQGTDIASQVSVLVELYDDSGKQMASSPAEVGSAALVPGATVGFSAAFPGIASSAEIKFEVRHRHLQFGGASSTPAPAEAEEGTSGEGG